MTLSAVHVAVSAGLSERLERGELIYYPVCPFAIPSDNARTFLAGQEISGSVHKNISYDPLSHRLHGHVRRSLEQTDRLQAILATFSQSLDVWLADQLPRYASHWELDRVSYRPLEEATRNLRLHARNDLLHVDAFPTRPTNGWRILRVFVNVNFTEPRVWVTSETFGPLLQRYGQLAGLPTQGFRLARAVEMLRDVPRLFRPTGRPRSEYDAFMHRFHNCLKCNEEFQEKSPKRLWTFPPGSAWMALTDTVSHAVLRGRYAQGVRFPCPAPSCVIADISRQALTADGVHGSQRLDESGRVDLMPLPFGAHIPANHLREGDIVGLLAQQRFHIDLIQSEQAVA
jgi:hypothetical protein